MSDKPRMSMVEPGLDLVLILPPQSAWSPRHSSLRPPCAQSVKSGIFQVSLHSVCYLRSSQQDLYLTCWKRWLPCSRSSRASSALIRFAAIVCRARLSNTNSLTQPSGHARQLRSAVLSSDCRASKCRAARAGGLIDDPKLGQDRVRSS